MVAFSEHVEEAQEAKVVRETRTIRVIETDADRKFILASFVIISFAVLMAIPLLYNNSALFTTIAATLSGFVGTIIGYYFGTSKEQFSDK